ncbi:Pimeloyl-ACP methyl ester carboxylesterase [Streptoalloteichus tenebrarius]|uniref:Pimeloyl-ACP methyl ester carboxylesterase n=1 Tax=Streptoalloteichus tenebrarius (strain ATCC 17920 / DSM 40477 / JCM 4838 / CBS 697.72 / NBRC 16177 / NCIMB 11028 / NRRL B-12390 / A12253. 1 / ISP 5477) TaxID=1933 RepID=A0ABT1HXE8_STRSD|nr:alpha/beta hydrolase [Streptoalloteichus tenebrarius]MCP2260189.1 Pimeloyl-ACP methyl ester carboxylesterase [Streptoalloteichus tenebrarius]
MKPLWRAVGLAGGVAGAVTGLVVGVTASRSRARRRADREPLIDPPADRECTVAADDGVPLSVEEVDPADGGEPDLTVVLVHGYTLDRRSWHFQRLDLPELTNPRVRLVRYDQRGHGRSGSSPRASCTLDQLGRDLDAVLRAVAPTGPVVLVGHSMGGMTIMALAELRPELFLERVVGVALLGTSAGEIGRHGLPRPVLSRYNPVTLGLATLAGWQPGLLERVRRVGDHLNWGAVRALAFGDRRVDPRRVDLVHRMLAETSVRAITDFLPTLGSHHRYAALAGLRQCEVLVMAGDADQITPFAHSEVIAAELPDAELVRVPGAGHMVGLEQPELVDELVAAFLRRCAVRCGTARSGADGAAGLDQPGRDRVGLDRVDLDRADLDGAGLGRAGLDGVGPNGVGPDGLGLDRGDEGEWVERRA